jgi:class 3 adenylate cyclase/tetratricopeptide (TPR) repeat protein
MQCGRSLDLNGPPPASVAPPVSSPETYTPRHLAEKILASREALAGERKQVTVLFADIVGSTELIRDLDPEDAQRLLDGVVTRMMEAVHRYEGTVSRLQGDGLMALFGAPIAHEDHAVRACYAALTMQEAVRRHADEVRRTHGAVLTIRVGLSAGEVVVRTISDDLHIDYTAMGQTVHLAARMEQLATPGATTLTAETVALVEGYVQVRSLGPMPVRGMPKPIEVFELAGAGPARTRLQAAASRGLTPFVGRANEIAVLFTALEQAKAGHGQVVAMVGEPGVGKSRLVWELTHSHRTQDWLVLESGSVSHGKATPWLPVVDFLKTYCRIEPRDDARTIREKLLGKLLALDEELLPLWPALLALLDQPVEEPGWLALDATHRRNRTLDGIKRLLLRESGVQPLLLVFEDLHWIDSETQVLLDSLVDGLPVARIVLLVNYRPEYRHDWGSKSYYTQVRVDSLAAESAHELLASLLGDDASLVAMSGALIARTAGNPFFLEECVQTLVETGALLGERGAYRPTRPLDTMRVPATVQAMLAARIDRLASGDKRLLQTAAVVGKDVPYGLLGEIADLSEEALRSALARLQAAEFLYEASLFPELEHTFKHALTHEVAYGSLLQDRRKALHARIVDAVERLYGGRLVEHVDRLADHAMRAERWEQAAAYARQAGVRAAQRMADIEADHRFEQALQALAQLPERREVLEEAVDIRLDFRPVLMALGDVPRMIELLREAEVLATRLDDARRLGRTRALMVRNLYILGEIDAAIETAQRAKTAGEALGDPSIWIPAAYLLANARILRGEFRAAVADCEQVMAASHGDLGGRRFGMVTQPGVAAYGYRAEGLAELGETQLALAAASEALRVAEATDHPYTLAGVLGNVINSYVALGRVDLALSTAARYQSLHLPSTDGNYRMAVHPRIGAAYALAGQYAEALPILEEIVADTTRTGRLGNALQAIQWLGEVYLRMARLDDAAEQAERLLAISRSRNLPAYTARALRLLGEIAASREPPAAEQAEDHYRQALSIVHELELRPLQAHCHLGLGKLYRRVGRSDEARAELATAVAMLREMGMMFWLPEAERELAQTINEQDRAAR